MEPERKCRTCGEAKPLTEFSVYNTATGARRNKCKTCESKRVSDWHSKHKDRVYEQNRVRYHVQKLDPDWYAGLLEKRRRLAPAQNQRLRTETILAYGGFKCACCGETEPRFLTIDHIENDGHIQRKVHRTGSCFYRWLRKNGYPKGFQVLCMNCNFGKAMNKGICPHKEGSTTRAEARSSK